MKLFLVLEAVFLTVLANGKLLTAKIYFGQLVYIRNY